MCWAWLCRLWAKLPALKGAPPAQGPDVFTLWCNCTSIKRLVPAGLVSKYCLAWSSTENNRFKPTATIKKTWSWDFHYSFIQSETYPREVIHNSEKYSKTIKVSVKHTLKVNWYILPWIILDEFIPWLNYLNIKT